MAALGLTLPHPFVGVLLWAWFTLQTPHQEAFGFIQSAPLNFIIACVTAAALLLSRERKFPPLGATSILLVVFLIWTTFNSFFAFDPSFSWPLWSRVWKAIAFGLIVAATANTRARLYALVWVAVISLFYFGVKGGLFTLMTGGNYHVLGPDQSMIGDNNQLAVALLMTLPLANYLRLQVANKYVAALLAIGSVLTFVAILGTYSRGGLVGLAVLALLMLMRSKNRIVYLAVVTVLCVSALYFMPTTFFDRANTLGAVQDDASFQGRLFAWRVAYMYATDHFPFGAGFAGPQLAAVFHHYFPGESLHAAHSIYFEVLGEHGYIGLAIYLLLLAATFLSCTRIIRRTRKDPAWLWAKDLAIALQSSLLVFCVAGAALSMAYYDLFIIEVMMLLALQEIVTRKAKRPTWEAVNAQPVESEPVAV